MTTLTKYISLIGINLLYASVTIFTKYASQNEFMSLKYIIGVFGAITILGIYAILWQQILKRMPVSEAYMFKGTSLIFILLYSYFLFGENITLNNIIGTLIIIFGITTFSIKNRRNE